MQKNGMESYCVNSIFFKTLALLLCLSVSAILSGQNIGEKKPALPKWQTRVAYRPIVFEPLAVKRFHLADKDSSDHLNIPGSQVFLPRWSAECLPFFCRIEHKIAEKSAVPFKFRLGSVEYVDWLEGKGDFPVFAPR